LGIGEVYYDSVVMFTFLMLGARYLEIRLKNYLQVEDRLLAALPRTATRIDNGNKHRVAVAALRAGDELWIGEGEQLPLDGQLLHSGALLEEAMLTGESNWRQREAGEQVFAGTFNRGAAFRIRATTAADASRLAQIDQLATTALDAKHQLASLADRVAGVFIPSILLIATATYLGWRLVDPAVALSAALAVLVVSCPCALSLAMPAALTAAIARLRRFGLVIKDSGVLERAHKVTAVQFDKTGTLTRPQLQIRKITPLADKDAHWCLQAASALQAHSSHPLASAFKTATAPGVTKVIASVGRGLSGRYEGHQISIGSAQMCGVSTAVVDPGHPGHTETRHKRIYLAVDDNPAAMFELAEQGRSDATDAVAQLRTLGIDSEIVSGDQAANCAPLAEMLGIPYVAGQTPEQKHAHLQQRRAAGHTLMYVGDGINDTPSLASADVSVATLESTDLVKSKTDVILLTQRLLPLVELLRVSKFTSIVMRQNLAWAFAYNLLAIPLAAFGYAPPWAAALGMSLSSIMVMLNASRILTTSSLSPSNSKAF
jgi:Cu2+-exporting ATPase